MYSPYQDNKAEDLCQICFQKNNIRFTSDLLPPKRPRPKHPGKALNSKLTTDSKLTSSNALHFYTLNSKLNNHLHQIIILGKHLSVLWLQHLRVNFFAF